MKTQKRLIWELYPSYLFIVIIPVVVMSLYVSVHLKRFLIQHVASELATRARLVDGFLSEYLSPLDPAQIDNRCKESGKNTDTRITVILASGNVIGDSHKDPHTMDNHAQRPEVMKATSGQTGMAVRYSRTLAQNMMYVAIPLKQDGKVQAVVRAALPLTSIEAEVRANVVNISIVGLVISIAASIICLYVSRRISQPIEELRQGAERFASGDLSYRLPLPPTREMATLANAMNHMADQLEDRIQSVLSQRNEIEAILASMLEGVIAIDPDEHILWINHAARRMLDSHLSPLKGRGLQELIRNPELNQLVRATLTKGTITEGDIPWHQDTERIFNFHCTPLHDMDDQLIGALLVFTDVSRLRHLENVRRDFVANVSHEIKTPLTAIKGFVETLRHGAVENPEEAIRFLNIIEKHVTRLNAIVDDLLQLSRLERQDPKTEINPSYGKIAPIIREAIQTCQQKADDKEITIQMHCEDALAAILDTQAMEQALVNLLDNAIKYSPEKSQILIRARQQDSQLVIQVQDFGTGIAKRHLPRIFERFYRVDPARSRKLGGTGLGLSIVKHIVQCHNGRIEVESTPGRGTTFTIHLPV